MKETCVEDLLPYYINGTLDAREDRRVRLHLDHCGACRAELASWMTVEKAATVFSESLPEPPAAVLNRALEQIESEVEIPWTGAEPRSLTSRLSLGAQLLRGQLPLVRREIWAASPLTMLVGCLVALMAATPGAAGATLAVFAPVIAAVGVMFVYGPENDPSLEVALSTPTSQRLVLLARLTLVYGYDLALTLVATGVLVVVRGGLDTWPLISLWVGPMLFLSALALLLSLLLGTATAMLVTMGLWASRLVAAWMDNSPVMENTGFPAGVQLVDAFWQANALLLPLAGLLLVVALWQTSRQERTVRL